MADEDWVGENGLLHWSLEVIDEKGLKSAQVRDPCECTGDEGWLRENKIRPETARNRTSVKLTGQAVVVGV